VRMIARPDTAILVIPSLLVNEAVPPDFPLLRELGNLGALPPGIHVVAPAALAAPGRWRQWPSMYRPFSHGFVPPQLLAWPGRLAALLEAFRPQLLHAMEIQISGYVALEAVRRLGRSAPPWIQSNWGSDTFLYHKQPNHHSRLSAVMQRADAYLAECERDQATAQALGYRGPLFPALPASGGADLARIARLGTGPASQRRMIVVKGYHNWSGRSLIAFSALALARERLRGVRIGVTNVTPAIERRIRLFRAETGLDIEALPFLADHDKALERLGQARLLLGIGISDGISTSVLEAMAMGAFPIQSATACVDEWFVDGVGGRIVSPHDTQEIARTVSEAMSDDRLVDQAAAGNLATLKARWCAKKNGARAWTIYESLLDRGAKS